MGLENITPASGFVTDLNPTWPLNTEDKREGDDHFHVTKQALRNTFPNASKKFFFPEGAGLAANTNIIATDQNKCISVNTTAGPVVLAMPALVAADWGWRVTVIKVSTDANPIYIVPPSGSILSGQFAVVKARRAVPFCPFDVVWTNNNWWVERIVGTPVACVIPFYGTVLPIGFAWPNGQTLLTADYPEYALARGDGTTPDLRERVLAGSTMLGATVGLISNATERSGINPTTLGAVGGTDVNILTHEQMPHHVHTMRSNNVANGFLSVADHSLGHNHGGATNTSTLNLDHTHDPPAGVSQLIGAGAAFVQSGSGPGIAGVSATGGVTSGGGAALDHEHGIDSALGATGHTVSGFTQYTGGKGSTSSASSSDFNPQAAIAHQNMPPTSICHYLIAVE